MDTIKATPGEALSYDPSEPVYWDPKALATEIERVFDVCHGCRLCFKLCPSFPSLFRAVDRHDGDVRELTSEETRQVVDECYQCKLCYIKCPYTPDDKHDFQLDFPRLMLRYTAQRARERGVGLREKVLGNPVAVGKLAGLAPGLANRANRSKMHRALMERMLGIHRDKQLPEFHRETFEKWLAGRARPTFEPRDEVVLFHTCFVNFNDPAIGRDAIEVLERNRIRVHSPRQTCCGMPALDGGDVEFARKQIRRNLASLTPHVRAGRKVLAINPTCSYMLKKEIVELLDPREREDALALANAARDTNEYLFALKQQDTLDRGFRSTPGTIAYHVPCHLKAQSIGFRSRDMMKAIPGTQVRVVDGCCGHDGTWSMKKENFEASMEVGAPVFAEMRASGGDGSPDECATDCPLAAIQIEQATGRKPLHPLSILARAYREEGFATRVDEPKAPGAAAGEGNAERGSTSGEGP